MKVKKVLLLNPPGERYYIRDCYCSTEAKGRYYWHPLDLLVQSGFLASQFRVTVLDAVALDLDMRQGLRMIVEDSPDAILFVTGALSWESDLALLAEVKGRKKSTILVGSGDLPRFSNGNLGAEWDHVDAILTDFTTPSLAEFLASGDTGPLPGLSVRVSGKFESVGDNRVTFDYPFPLHGSFPQDRYRLPFPGERKFASVLTTFGCTFLCKFCNVNSLPFKIRPPERVENELRRLVSGLGIRTIFFRDPNIAIVRSHLEELVGRITALPFRMQWNGYSRVDNVDFDLLSGMARSGCSLLQFGLESGSERMLEQAEKGFSHDKIRETISDCRRAGIKACGHFILGLPGESIEEMESTIKFARELSLDFASFNLFEKRPGISDDFNNARPNPAPADRMKKRAIKKFYLNPSFMAKKLVSAVLHPRELRALLGNLREFFRIMLA